MFVNKTVKKTQIKITITIISITTRSPARPISNITQAKKYILRNNSEIKEYNQ